MSKRKASINGDDAEPSAKLQSISNSGDSVDYFKEHFCQNLDEKFANQLKNGPLNEAQKIRFKGIDKSHSAQYFDNGFELHWNKQGSPELPYQNVFLHKRLLKHLNGVEQNEIDSELFGIIGRYVSMCCVTKSLEYMRAYCMHVLNHILRTRTIIIENQKKLDNARNNLTDELIESTRDQGYNRPKVLILTPFKKVAYQIVDTMANLLLPNERNYVMNSKKFEEEYGDTGEAINEKWRSSAEFKELMSGNIDDSFRIGLSLGKKAIKLFTAFENSDVIICSPLGLRMIIGEEEQESKKREFDFLSSIEVLIFDKINVLLMQNWEHLLTIMESINSIPVNVEADISRVRSWTLDGHGKFYRQTIAFSEINFTELRILFAKYDRNFAGLLNLTSLPFSRLDEIEVPIVQELHRFDCDDPEKQSDLRFDYFVRNILLKLKTGTLIFVPSYFDYIRLRNHFKKDNESFAQIHEYASDAKIKKSRKAFGSHEKKLMLLTERVHFFRHIIVKGVKSVVFYQMPTNPEFYAQMINMTNEEGKIHSQVIYSNTDVIRMQNVFGPKYTKELFQSEKKFHALISE
ncbi:U3 small nucleolar RNA-associated protein 25-like protein [Aphelenchoides bicaudatus]|nr:U3 small nucleolar RNA-associated protein 25-like protein [Aphelenchoides bicaudatus]